MQIEAEKRKQEELAAAEAKMKKLEGARLRLERELTILHTAKADMTLEDEADAEEEKRLRAELEEIEGELEQERLEFEEVAEEQANIQTEIAEFKNRLNELQVVNDRLENENTDLIDQAAATNKNLEEMRVMIEREAAQRTALEAYIKQLKNEVIELYDPDKAEQLRERQNMEDEENAGIHANGDPLPAPGEMSAEDELKELKQRLQDEKDERLRLKDLTETLEAERNRIQEDVLNEEVKKTECF